MLSPGRPSKLLVILAFAAIYVIWGSTYLGVLIAIRDIPPLLMSGGRFLTAGLIILAFLYVRGERLPPLSSICKIAFSGILMLFLGTGAVAWVEQYIPSGLAAVIVATVPLWFVLLDKTNWQITFRNKGMMAGLILGFIGVVTLFGDTKMLTGAGNSMGLISFFVLLAGTIAWAAGSLYSKYQPMKGSTAMKASIQMIAAGTAALIAGWIAGEHRHFHISNVGTEPMLALAYLIFCGSLIGYMAYVWLLSVRSPAIVGTYAYVNPVVAVFLGWLIADEAITQLQLISLTVILAGVIMVTLSKEKKPAL